MIKITIFSKNELSLGFKIQGHALSRREIESTTGEAFDMICNSVSVLSQSTIIGLEEVLKLQTKYEIEDGFINLNLSHLTIEEIQSAQVLLKTTEKSFKSLQMSLEASFGKNKCNKYIKILEEEVQKIC